MGEIKSGWIIKKHIEEHRTTMNHKKLGQITRDWSESQGIRMSLGESQSVHMRWVNHEESRGRKGNSRDPQGSYQS
jgi:hypothetical protein